MSKIERDDDGDGMRMRRGSRGAEEHKVSMTGCFAHHCCCMLLQTHKGFGLAAAALSQHMLLFGADCWMAALAVTVTDSCHIEIHRVAIAGRFRFPPQPSCLPLLQRLL